MAIKLLIEIIFLIKIAETLKRSYMNIRKNRSSFPSSSTNSDDARTHQRFSREAPAGSEYQNVRKLRSVKIPMNDNSYYSQSKREDGGNTSDNTDSEYFFEIRLNDDTLNFLNYIYYYLLKKMIVKT